MPSSEDREKTWTHCWNGVCNHLPAALVCIHNKGRGTLAFRLWTLRPFSYACCVDGNRGGQWGGKTVVDKRRSQDVGTLWRVKCYAMSLHFFLSPTGHWTEKKKIQNYKSAESRNRKLPSPWIGRKRPRKRKTEGWVDRTPREDTNRSQNDSCALARWQPVPLPAGQKALQELATCIVQHLEYFRQLAKVYWVVSKLGQADTESKAIYYAGMMVTVEWTKQHPRKKSHPNLLHDKPVNTPYSNVDTEYQPKQNDHTATRKDDFMENSRPYTGVEGTGRRKRTKSVSQTVRSW